MTNMSKIDEAGNLFEIFIISKTYLRTSGKSGTNDEFDGLLIN